MIVRRRRRPMGAATALLSAVLAFAAVAAVEASSSRPALAAAGDWPTYLHDPQRTAADRTVTGLSPSTAPNLVQRWADRTGGAVLSSPTVVGGVVYVGSGDGYEYALNATTGATIWKTFLGVTSAPDCNPPIVGVSSAATVQDGVLYAGGGDAYWYALDAATGVVLWRVFTGDNSATGGHYNWSSPLIYNGFGYIGIASLGDCPLVQGQLLQVSLSTHTVTRTLDIVPPGRVGGGIWTSPAVEAATNTLFVTTGTQEFFLQPMIQAMVALDATTLAVKGAWQIPPNRAVVDSDWGTTPILFTDAAGTRLVAAINKDGYAYAFRRDDVGAGPVWDQRLAFGGTCPICGEGSVSSGAFDGSRLYFAGGSTMIRGLGAAGSVRALDPATGIPIWEHRAAGAVVPALAYANGLVIAAGGPTLEVLSAATGARLYSFTTGNSIYSAASVSNGMIYFGSTDGYVYALGTRSPTVPPSDPTCPSGWTCQDIGGPSPPGRQTVSGDRWTVAVGGSGVAGLADQFRLISQNLNEDGRVLAQVTAMPGPGTGAQGGVMVRQRNDPGAPYYALLAGPSGLRVQYRTRFGAPAVSAVTVPMPRLPAYLEIVRTGDLFQAATSADGVTFTLVPGGDFAVPMPATVMAGVATTSQAQGTDATASYAAVAVAGPGAAPVPPPTPSPCPSGWSCAGVGNPTAVGDQSLAGGRWTVKGAGVDLIGYTDQLHLAWRSLGTAGTISATVTSLTAPTGGARAGPMIRQSASDPGSIFYAAVVVPGGTLAIIDRPHQGLLVQQVMTTPLSLPASIQIARTGDTYCTYTSAGGGGWTYLPGSCTTLDPSSTSVAGLAVTSGAPAALATATFDAVSMSATPPPLPTVCPSGWNCGDIGYPTPPGSQSVSGGVWTIVGSGSDIWFQYDQFRLVWQPLPDDGSVSARITSQQNSDPWAKAGVMLRESGDPSSPFYAAYLTPANGVNVQFRSRQGVSAGSVTRTSGSVPAWLRVTRSGSIFCTYTSADGVTWTFVTGSCMTMGMTGSLLAGMAVTSHNYKTTGTVTFDGVSVALGTVPPPTACPGTGWVCEDIGDPTPSGSQSVSGGTWTMRAGGGDIWGTADQFHMISRPVPMDATVSARVVSQGNTSPWAKAGVMLRQSSDPTAPYYAAFVTPGHGVVIQFRAIRGDPTQQPLAIAGAAPAFLQVTRFGNTYCAYTSSDGATWQYLHGSCQDLVTTGTVLGGMAATSHNTDGLSTVTFDTVGVTSSAPTPPTQCPLGWTCTDVGGAAPTGDQVLSGGTWTINGGGGDIWGTRDQFHFVSQPLPGSGRISARVVSQGATNPWAKAGVMLRQNTDPGSPYYAVYATPANGVVVQYRAAQGGSAVLLASVAGRAPAYLRVGIAGTTFTAYTSIDGVAWTPIAGSSATVTMASPVMAGLAVTSHDTSMLSQATFDSTTVEELTP